MSTGFAYGRAAPSTSRSYRTHRVLGGLVGWFVAAALVAGAPALAQTAVPIDEAAPARTPVPAPAPAPAEDSLAPPSPRIIALTRENAAAGPGDEAGRATGAGASTADPARSGDSSDELLTVFLDHAKIIRLPERTQTVIVGNPFIADITLQRNGIVVVTGKSYGATNLIALDSQGVLLAESMVSVRAPTDSVVVVQRGLARESYSCTPNCQPSLRLGDAPEYFGAVGDQATQRSGLAAQAR